MESSTSSSATPSSVLDRKQSFSQVRLAELQSIQRSSSVREISQKFKGGSKPEPQETFQQKQRIVTNSDRLLKFAISSNQKSPPSRIKNNNANNFSSPSGVTSSAQSSPTNIVSPQLSPIMRDHQQWTIEKKSSILSQWSQAMVSENPTASVSKCAAEESLANLGISPHTVSKEQWQEWHDAIEEIVSKHQPEVSDLNTSTTSNNATDSPQACIATRLFESQSNQDEVGSNRMDTSNEDADSDCDKTNAEENYVIDEAASESDSVYSQPAVDVNANLRTTPDKFQYDPHNLVDISQTTVNTTHLFDSISTHSETTATSDTEDSVSIEINKRLKKKSPITRNENSLKIRRGSTRGGSGAIHITNNVVLDATSGKDDKPQQLSLLHLLVAILCAIILGSLGYYFVSVDNKILSTFSMKSASVNGPTLVDVLPSKHANSFADLKEPVQVLSTSTGNLFNSAEPQLPDNLAALKQNVELAAIPDMVGDVPEKKQHEKLESRTALPLAVSEYVSNNNESSADLSSDGKQMDSQPISMKISIMVRKPNQRRRNPFAIISEKIASFFGKIFKVFGRKKKQTNVKPAVV